MDLCADTTATYHLQQMSEQAKTGHIGTGIDPDSYHRRCGSFVERRHHGRSLDKRSFG